MNSWHDDDEDDDDSIWKNHFLLFLTFPTRKNEPKPKRFALPFETQGVGTFKTGLILRPLG